MADARNRRHIMVFASITALCLFGDSMLYVVLPVHYAAAGLGSLWEVGVILAVNRLIRLPLNLCMGWCYSRFSERSGILIAVVLATLTTLSYGFLPGFAWWVLARCVWGLAWTLLRLGSLFCILRLAGPEARGRYTGLYNGIYRLGSLVGMFLGGLLADLAGVRATALIFGVATACAVPLVLCCIPRDTERQAECAATPEPGLREGLALAARNRAALWTVAAGGAASFVFGGVTASTLSRLIAVHSGGGVVVAGALVGAATLAGFFQALRWGWEPWLAPLVGRLSDRPGGRNRMLFLALGLAAGVFASLALSLPLPLWFCCLAGMQLTGTVLTTVLDAAAADAAAATGGRAVLMGYSFIVDGGAALGPLFAYGLNEFMGINAVYLICAALLFALAFRWRLFSRAPAA